MRRTFFAGLVLVLMVTPVAQAAAAEPSFSACAISPSAGSALDTDATESSRVAADALNSSVYQRVTDVTGKGAVKERIADQLRRGVIGTTSDGTNVTVVTTPEFKRSAELRGSQTKVITGCFTAGELIEVDDILNARAWHPDAVKASFSFSLHANDSRYYVTFDEQYPEAGKALAALLGKRAVVSYGENHRTGRTDDGRLHYGASGIRDQQYNPSNTCTAGFTFWRGGTTMRGSFSAAHCFGNGRPIMSGPKAWGYTFGRTSFPNYDIVGITGEANAYTNVIHTDSCCPVTRRVVGNDPAWVGQSVCFSGMVTRSTCSITVTSTNGTYCDSYGCTGGLIEATRGAGQVIWRLGDSGAPVYTRVSTDRANGVGMLVGGVGGGTIGYAEHLSTIEYYLQVSLLTWA